MIILETEPALPETVQRVKDQVLACLAVMHQPLEFTTRPELRTALDEVLEQMAAADLPRGLMRVLLFYRDPGAIEDVQHRMLPGAAFHVFRTPGCWMELGHKLPELTRWAQRIEPNFPELLGI